MYLSCQFRLPGLFKKTIAIPLLLTLLTGNAAIAATQSDTPVSAQLLAALRNASQHSLNQPVPPVQDALKSVDGPSVTSGKKPGVLYMGADYCPYCAAIRWPLVLALLRFGQFQNLHTMRSSSSDVYADTVTFSFHGAQYRSRYLTFQSVELQDRQRKPLERPTPQQIKLFRTYDAPPYTQQPGSIPFLYIGGSYTESGAPFDPGLLKDRSWSQTARQIAQPGNVLSRQVLGTANVYTAAICGLTDGKPAAVCTAAAVKNATGRLTGNRP